MVYIPVKGCGGMTVDAEGNLVLLDGDGQIIAFLPDGRYLYHVAHKKGYPGQIVCDANNRLYYTMGGNRLLAVQLSDEIPMVQDENPYASHK